jgi:hypothetical protein
MAEQKERKPGTGVAFVNKNKKEDWHADWTGEFAAHDGTVYYLNVSKKVGGHSGTEYITVGLGKPKVAAGTSTAPNNSPQARPMSELQDLPDDLLF